MRKLTLILSCFLFFTAILNAQVDRADQKQESKNQTDEVSPVMENQVQPAVGEFGSPGPPPSPKKAPSPKKTKTSKKKEKANGPNLIAEHKKRKITREFKIGEVVKFKTKTEKDIQKGILESIEGQFVTIDGKKIRVSNLEIVGKKFSKTMGWRSAGVANFAIGTGLTAAGIALIVVSSDLIDPNSTKVVWGTLGVVAGTGTGLVGLHLMIKGGRGVFQSSKLKSEKGWSFSIK